MEFERVGRYLNDKMCLLLQTPSNLENDFQRHFSRSVTKEHSAACWPARAWSRQIDYIRNVMREAEKPGSFGLI